MAAWHYRTKAGEECAGFTLIRPANRIAFYFIERHDPVVRYNQRPQSAARPYPHRRMNISTLLRALQKARASASTASVRSVAGAGLWLILLLSSAHAQLDRDAARFVDAVAKINEAHARAPGKNTEADLSKRLPIDARAALQRMLQAKPSPTLLPSLLKCAEAALDLDLITEFDALRAKIIKDAPGEANSLGIALSRPRFIVRGIGGLTPEYLNQFAGILDQVLTGYDEVFGFAEFSKVPGKKLRVRVHLEPSVTKPPHFAPQFPWHSEIDFPVADASGFRSPTPQGHFLFYGLCHELGHVIAMWGDLTKMEDQHAWAHYTGVVITDHVSKKLQGQPQFAGIQDIRWRSIAAEKQKLGGIAPSVSSTDGVMALLMALHDMVDPKTIGAALNSLDAKGKGRRINKVRYYDLAEYGSAVSTAVQDPQKARAVRTLFASALGK